MAVRGMVQYPQEALVAIILILRKQEHRIEDKQKITVAAALARLGLSSETHLVLRDGELLTDDALLRDGDQAQLIAVISGGRA